MEMKCRAVTALSRSFEESRLPDHSYEGGDEDGDE